jgi:hypothetical protein
MDLNRAFSFVFDDEAWIAIILLLGLTLLIPPLGAIAMTGLTLFVADRVRRGAARPLPGSQDFVEVLKKGLYGLGISLYYSLPLLIIGVLFACGFFFVAVTESEALLITMSLVSLCLSLPLFLLALVIQPLTFAAQARWLRTGSFAAALRLGAVIAALRANLANWLVLWLLSLLCAFIGSLGSLALGIGVLLTVPFAAAVLGHLFGQLLQTLPAIDHSSAATAADVPPPTA